MNHKKFIATFTTVQHKMYLLALRLLVSKEEAADAVQETMARLWEKKDKLDKVASKEAYAMQMVKNYALDRLKSKQASHLSIVHSNYDSGALNAQDDLEREAQVTMVQKMINELPDNYKTVIQLRDIQEYDFEAIAQIMDMKAITVRVTLSRARKMLKERIEEQVKKGIA